MSHFVSESWTCYFVQFVYVKTIIINLSCWWLSVRKMYISSKELVQ